MALALALRVAHASAVIGVAAAGDLCLIAVVDLRGGEIRRGIESQPRVDRADEAIHALPSIEMQEALGNDVAARVISELRGVADVRLIADRTAIDLCQTPRLHRISEAIDRGVAGCKVAIHV